MATATIEGPEGAPPDRAARRAPRHQRRRVTALLVCGAAAVVVVGLDGHERVQAGQASSPSSGWHGSSRSSEAEAERGRAADAARLEAAADAYVAEQANLERGRAADSARLEQAADAYFTAQANLEREASDAARLAQAPDQAP